MKMIFFQTEFIIAYSKKYANKPLHLVYILLCYNENRKHN